MGDLLETDGDHCLLVFDDVADPDALSPFVPDSGSAQVLIVSTRHTAPNTAAVVADVFGADEALSFLRSRTGLDDEAGAAEVAAVLGHLPLALALAAQKIQARMTSATQDALVSGFVQDLGRPASSALTSLI